MSSAIFAKAQMRSLAAKAAETVSNPNLTNAQKKTVLDQIDVDLKAHSQTITVHDQASRLMSGGSSLGSDEGMAFGSRSFASSLKSGRVPRLVIGEEETKALFNAANTKQAMRIETKAAMDPAALLPAQLLPGIVGFAHEPVRVLDYVPATPMSGPSIDFISHTSTTGAPGMVAKGGTKPEVEFNTAATILSARKIAGWCSLFDEDLADFPQFTAYLQNELIRVVTDVENTQVLTGDGTGQNLLGLLNVSGILTRAKATDTNLDACEQAIADLRVGAAFVEPDTIVIHPTSWSIIRRSKDSQLRYLLNADPSSLEANSLWGIRVLATTAMPVGTALFANLEQGAQAFIRQGFTIEMSNQSGTSFTTNTTVVRAEERLALGSPRPAALLKLTGIA